ncbi:hypothetical protein BCU96_13000 [Vibrio lentus]|nr:hypothetical protein BCU96_13000 [Vibrio lentus]PMN12674.1 hypothetical protein BCT39_24230 [Vibrio lentus]
MTRHNFVGYHTCQDSGGYAHVRTSIPFISGNGTNQWLTQGYYFWTDSPYWAKKWGKDNNKVIGKFIIDLCIENELLDLVGNVAHSEHFEDLVHMLREKLQGTATRDFTVNQAIGFLRKLERTSQYSGIFPYKAIKAEDNRYDSSMCFIDPKPGKQTPILRLKRRQQMCVFTNAKHQIKLDGFVEPEAFVNNFNNE